jgi:hypothetical protein
MCSSARRPYTATAGTRSSATLAALFTSRILAALLSPWLPVSTSPRQATAFRLEVPTTLYIQNQAGTGAANIDAAQVTAESYLAVDGYAAAGAGCGQNGLIGQDGSGRLLSCVNGVWTAAGGSSGTNNYVSEDFTNGGVFWIPANTKRVDGYIQVSWTGSNAGVAEFVVHDTNGNIQNTFMAGDYGWNDGGSGSEWWIPVSIPVVSNSANIQMVQVNGSNTLNWHVASYEN